MGCIYPKRECLLGLELANDEIIKAHFNIVLIRYACHGQTNLSRLKVAVHHPSQLLSIDCEYQMVARAIRLQMIDPCRVNDIRVFALKQQFEVAGIGSGLFHNRKVAATEHQKFISREQLLPVTYHATDNTDDRVDRTPIGDCVNLNAGIVKVVIG